MKRSNLSKMAGAGILALSLTFLPSALPASAQTNTTTNTNPTLDTTPFQETKDDNNNWGWLGLIGLIGLANLFRKHEETTVRRDVDGTGTGY